MTMTWMFSGGKLTTNPGDCTVLVTDQIRRTAKFLCTMGKGIPIVSRLWLLNSKDAKMFLGKQTFMSSQSYDYENSERNPCSTCRFEEMWHNPWLALAYPWVLQAENCCSVCVLLPFLDHSRIWLLSISKFNLFKCFSNWPHVNISLDPWKHILADDESEKKWGFKLNASLAQAAKEPLLQGYKVGATKKCMPPPDQLKGEPIVGDD